MKRKFKVTLAVFLVIILGCFSNVFAAANYDEQVEIGMSNLNRTAENSAKIGDQLFHPERGWNRYDDDDSKIEYLDSWQASAPDDPQAFYNSSIHSTSTVNDSVSFRFYGTKLRIIQTINNNRNTDVSVTIDGVIKSTYSVYNTSAKFQILKFEQQNLNLGVHNVRITKTTDNTMYMDLDAIDIGWPGYLIDPSEKSATGITLNKTTDFLVVRKTEILTALVLPTNAIIKDVKWTSSDPSIVTVDDDGKIAALKKGTAVITATVQDGSNLHAQCTIHVH